MDELDEAKADASKYIFNLIEHENDLKSMVATEAYQKMQIYFFMWMLVNQLYKTSK